MTTHDASPLSAQNPWPGLRAFLEADQQFFFGREQETAELVSLVGRAPVTVLYGQSGLGKTSLLQAGVFPELKKLDYLPVWLRLDYEADAPPLDRQILHALAAELERAHVSAPLPGDAETLWEYFHRRDVDFWGPRNRLLMPVLALDQFEEIFTLGRRDQHNAAQADRFVAELESLLEHRPPEAVRQRLEEAPEEARRFNLRRESTRFILSLREDFLPDLDSWRTRVPSLLPHRYRLHRMTGKQALEVVLRSGGTLVDAEVAGEIVGFVSTSQRTRNGLAVGDRLVEPALLSLVCHELNQRRIDRDQDRITADLLTGERERIIQNFYDRSFEGIDPRVRDWVEDELLTASGYRDRAALEDALKLDLPAGDFDQLVDRRLLHREERSGVLWLELTHDLLTDPAAESRTLRHQRLRDEATASREATIQRELRRTRLTAAFFAALFLLTIGLVVFAWSERHSAYVSATKAEKSADTARDMKGKAEQSAVTAEGNFRIASDLVDSVGFDVAGDVWTPTAGVIRKIKIIDESFARFAEQRTLAAMHQRHSRFLSQAANALYEAGHIGEGLGYARNAVDAAGNEAGLARAEALKARGQGLLETGKQAEASADLKEAVKLAEAEKGPGFARVYVPAKILLCWIANNRYDYAEAAALLDRASHYIESSGERGDEVEVWKARIQILIGVTKENDAETLKCYRQARAILQQVRTRSAENPAWDKVLADVDYRIAYIARSSGDLDQASSSMLSSRNLADRLVERDAQNWEWLRIRARSLRGLGWIEQDQGAWDQARQTLTSSEKDFLQLRDAQPEWIRARSEHAWSLIALGDLARAQRNWEAAEQYYRPALLELRVVAARAPGDMTAARDVAVAIERPAWIELDRPNRDYNLMATRFRQSLAVLQAIPDRGQFNADVLDERAVALWFKGYSQDQLKKPEEAIAAYREAASLRERYLARDPKPEVYYALSEVRLFLANTLDAKKDYGGAAENLRLALLACNDALRLRPGNIAYLQRKVNIDRRVSEVSRERGDLNSAASALEDGVRAVWEAIQSDFGNNQLREELKKLDAERKLVLAKAGGKDAPVEARKGLEQRLDAAFKAVDTNRLFDREPQGAWFLPPFMPGAWQAVGMKEWDGVMRSLTQAAGKPFTPKDARRIRRLPIDFYENAAIYEIEMKRPDGSLGILAFLERGHDTLFLNGISKGIHAFNAKSPPRLDTPARAEAYLRFFVGALKGSEGRFQIVDQEADLNWREDAKPELKKEVGGLLKPLVIEPSKGGGWQTVATQLYTNYLFHVFLSVTRDGTSVAMADEKAIKVLPVYFEDYVNGFRALREQSLKDEVQAREKSLETALAERKSHPQDEKTRDAVRRAYLNLSWVQIKNGDDKAALPSTESGLQIDPGYLPLQMNRAHALMFLGRPDEAEAVYRRNIGKQVFPDSPRLWEQEVLSDFDTLETEGRTHPLMNKIRELMKSAKSAAK